MDHAIKRIRINHTVHDNTKPSAKMGRKAYRVSKRQPGCRNATLVSAPAFLLCKMKCFVGGTNHTTKNNTLCEASVAR